MSEMHGRYPGGPSRDDPEEGDHPRRQSVRLPSVGEIEARRAAGSIHRKRERRRKRLLWGLIASAALAVALGVFMGVQSRRTEEELARELQEQTAPKGFDPAKEADRLINEIWKTEALERRPRGR